MKIQYQGPTQFRRIVEETCTQVKEDYERQDVVIAVARPFFYPVDKNEPIGIRFPTQEFINTYVGTRIGNIEKLLNRRRGISEQRFRDLCSELRKFSFTCSVDEHGNAYDNAPGAMYEPVTDKVYLDPLTFSLYYLCTQRGVGVPNDTDQVEYIRHELVHNDMGKSVPHEELRRATAPYYRFWHNVQRGASLTGQAHKKWMEGPEGKNFFSTLRQIGGGDGNKALEATHDYLLNQSEQKSRELEPLHLPIGEEALAHNYAGDKELFMADVSKRYDDPALFERASTLFDTIEKRIMEAGRLETLREMKRRMDEAFHEKVSVLDVYSV
ncbi:MAG TPA: hypothetical protein VJA18_02240 [Candidatus Nanoarchaeia archaeon]|nr:hypothetical protein [Candidatus Nanoarchaeia archaeon]